MLPLIGLAILRAKQKSFTLFVTNLFQQMDKPYVIDVSEKKGRRITESVIEGIVELKQELLSIPPLISSLVEGRGSQHLNRYYELSKRIDGHFEDIFDQLSYISMFRC